MKIFDQKLFGLTGTLLVATVTCAQNYALDWFTIGGGGGTSIGGGYSMSGTIAQTDASAMSGGAFTLQEGFWSILGTFLNPVTTIFDNTGGSDNGVQTATTNDWLAEKFCIGAQAYGLDSVTLPLSSGDNNGQPRVRSVRLQIYSNDPVSGKPSVSTGVLMNLSGATNPITLGVGSVETLIKWIPATPFTLLANTCYWIVLSTDSGIVYQTASFTLPTGSAAAFGRVSSGDAGATWGPVDNTSNRRMLIEGSALTTPPELGIIAAERIGSDLRLSFASVAGRNYAVQSRADLSSGAWTSLPGAPIPGTGGTAQITLPNALGQPQQFYRVKIVP